MKAELQAPPEWISRRYYEIQVTEPGPIVEEEADDDFKVTLREGLKIGIGAAMAYVVIVVMIILLS